MLLSPRTKREPRDHAPRISHVTVPVQHWVPIPNPGQSGPFWNPYRSAVPVPTDVLSQARNIVTGRGYNQGPSAKRRRPNSDSDMEESNEEKLKRQKREAQKRYRIKKKGELHALKQKMQTLQAERICMKETLTQLAPYHTMRNLEQARLQVGKAPRVWIYKETWPECRILAHANAKETLGYRLQGRDCWEYKRFPGLTPEQVTAVKQAWDQNIRAGGHQLVEFMDTQYFQRMYYRDGQLSWRWSQVQAKVDTNLSTDQQIILECVEFDIHNQVLWAQGRGVEDFKKSIEAGSKVQFAAALEHNSYAYKIVIGDKGTEEFQVSELSPEAEELLGWNMDGMQATDAKVGHELPFLSGDKAVDLDEFFSADKTLGPLYAQRERIVNGKSTLVPVEIWLKPISKKSDARTIHVLERIWGGISG